MTRAFYNLRHQEKNYIQKFGEHGVKRIKDISLDYDSNDGELPNDKPVSPPSEMITFELENSTVMTLRGSGTEPKLKYYIEAKGTSMEQAKQIAESVEIALKAVLQSFGLGG